MSRLRLAACTVAHELLQALLNAYVLIELTFRDKFVLIAKEAAMTSDNRMQLNVHGSTSHACNVHLCIATVSCRPDPRSSPTSHPSSRQA
jgi:hypothetical protein